MTPYEQHMAAIHAEDEEQALRAWRAASPDLDDQLFTRAMLAYERSYFGAPPVLHRVKP